MPSAQLWSRSPAASTVVLTRCLLCCARCAVSAAVSCVQTLYEAWFDGLVDLKREALDLIYRRREWARLILDWSHVKFFVMQFIPELLKHTRAQDVEQVRDHYDRGDDFYAGFLGPLMVYTSGMFLDPERDTLEQAQTNKFELVNDTAHRTLHSSHGSGQPATLTVSAHSLSVINCAGVSEGAHAGGS
jgi:hypothetical protein